MRTFATLQALCLLAMFALPACDGGEASKDEKKADDKANATPPPAAGASAPAGSKPAGVNVQAGAGAKVEVNPHGAVVRDGAGNEVVTDEHGAAVRRPRPCCHHDKGNVNIKAADGSRSATTPRAMSKSTSSSSFVAINVTINVDGARRRELGPGADLHDHNELIHALLTRPPPREP